MVFGGKSAIWMDLDLGDVPSDDVKLRDLWGGAESVGGSGEVKVDTDVLEQTLGTGLFTSRGSGRLGWSHQTYAEFLAARYVVQYAMPTTQVMSLLVSSADPDGRLIPQLHGTAAWIASMRPDVFDTICDADPEVLLSSDRWSLSDTQRETLVGHLLEQYDSGRIVDRYEYLFRRLTTICHPLLDEQLRPYLRHASHNTAAQQIAVRIAGACRVVSVQTELVDLALDVAVDDQLRIEAAFVVGDIAEPSTKSRMKPLATGDIAGDANLELKGCALQAVWPDSLSADELFNSLVPPPPGLIGLYSGFLFRNPVDSIKSEDLPAAMRWAIRQVGNEESTEFDRLVDAVLLHAMNAVDQPAILTSVADLILARLVNSHHVFSNADVPAVQSALANDDLRRRIVKAMIERLPDPIGVFDLVYARPRLVSHEDFDWMLAQFSETTQPFRHTWGSLAERLYNPDDSTQGNLLLLAVESSDELFELFRYWVQAVAWPSAEADRLRKQFETIMGVQHPPETERQLLDPRPAERVDRVLTYIEQGQLDRWEQLVLELTLLPDSTHYDNVWRISILQDPGWIDADDDTRRRILHAALAYLQSANPEAESRLGTNSFPYAAIAGMNALHLLYVEEPLRLKEISADQWDAWTPVILRFAEVEHGDDGEAIRNLPCVALAHSRRAITDSAIGQLERDNAANTGTAVFDRLTGCWDSELQQSIQQWTLEHDVSPRTLRAVGDHLLQYSSPVMEDYLRRQLTLPIPQTANQRERAVSAAWVLIMRAPDAGWSAVWPAIVSEPEFGRTVMIALAGRQLESPIGLLARRLTEENLADLYLWLSQHFPRHVAWPRGEMREITPEQNIDQFRSSLLNALANKGTSVACSEIERILEALPTEGWLRRILDDARRITRSVSWLPPTPQEIIGLAQSDKLRLVHTGDQLLDVIEESLNRLQRELHGETPAVRFIWDKVTKHSYRPVDENTLSDFIKLHLDRDLRTRGVVVNREVQIHRGERTDIHVDAVTRADDTFGFDTVIAIIEVKGSWHDEVFTAMESQLVERYLVDNHCEHGIFLVGWFDSSDWDPRDRRRQKTLRHNLSRVEASRRLQQQASEASKTHRSVRAFVLDTELR